MKNQIKIKKREDRKVTNDADTLPIVTNRQRTTEAIVKTWIIESRERRRVAPKFAVATLPERLKKA